MTTVAKDYAEPALLVHPTSVPVFSFLAVSFSFFGYKWLDLEINLCLFLLKYCDTILQINTVVF